MSSRLSSASAHAPYSTGPSSLFNSHNMPPPPTVPSRKRKAPEVAEEPLAGPSRSPSSSASGDLDGEEEADGEYEPSPGPGGKGGRAGKRAAGARNGGGSKSANGRPMSREALRKANHSLIERRRREKINAALGDLREMVPGLGEGMSKGGEFKLEVLERTVGYMRQLRQQVVDLEVQLGFQPSIAGLKPSRDVSVASKGHPPSKSPLTKKSRSPTISKSHSTSASPPTPTPSESPSIDPNETDAESGLPPQFAVAHRSPPNPPPPSIASLLSGGVRASAPVPASRPLAPPQANNPTLYLPFPTPSPTSPFLTYSGTSSSSAGVTEPSPFLAPIQNMGLFGGVLNLDTPEGEAVDTKGQDPSTEEAANLLLAFSSPDTLRPSPANGIPMGLPGGRERRSTLESEEFMLDGGNGVHERVAIRVDARSGGVAGKTAKDILRM